MYTIKRPKQVKDRDKGFLLTQKATWNKQHVPARQSNKSVRNTRKAPKGK